MPANPLGVDGPHRRGNDGRSHGQPLSDAEPKHTYAIFLDHRPPRDALEHAVGQSDEKVRLGEREIFVHYGSGMGRSKLRIPAAKLGTARNMNTVAKLTEIASRP